MPFLLCPLAPASGHSGADRRGHYYTTHIQGNPEWIFAGVYSDAGITGTSMKKRDGFNQMVADALAGKIDLILTKSVSRFAQNISDNTAWGQRKRFADGKMSLGYSHFLGYRKGAADGEMEIVEEEAVIVRRIYAEFLAGKFTYDIAARLTEEGIPTPAKKTAWHASTVESILHNEKYKRDAILHESPQSMIQSAEDFSILPMKKPGNQGKSGTQGVRISSGVPLFSFCGVKTPSGEICNLHPPPVPQEGKLKGWGNR